MIKYLKYDAKTKQNKSSFLDRLNTCPQKSKIGSLRGKRFIFVVLFPCVVLNCKKKTKQKRFKKMTLKLQTAATITNSSKEKVKSFQITDIPFFFKHESN